VKDFDYVLARDAAEASAAARRPNAVLKAGGTELLDRMKERVTVPATVVNLLTAKGLAEVSVGADAVRLGAAATLTDLVENADLARVAPAVVEAARETATPLVRNRGTVGGNLAQRPRCWYFRNETYECLKKGGAECFGIPGENRYLAVFGNGKCAAVHPSNLATALWALDAKIHVRDGAQESTLAFDAFFVAPEQDVLRENVLTPGQVITAVSFDAAPARASAYYEVNEKDSYDWALASCAVRLRLEGDRVAEARVVASAVAPTPIRLTAAEAALKDKTVGDATFAAAAEEAVKGATPLRDNAYKVVLLKTCVRRALAAAAARGRAR